MVLFQIKQTSLYPSLMTSTLWSNFKKTHLVHQIIVQSKAGRVITLPHNRDVFGRLTLPNNVHAENDIRIEKRICKDSNGGTPSPFISTVLGSLRIISLQLKLSGTHSAPKNVQI